MSDESNHSRRSVLRTVGLAAGSAAVGGVGTAGADASCDGATETTVEEGGLSGASSADTLTHTTQLDDPCEVVFSLSSVEPTDFDLYLTLDGRVPTTEDFDRKSVTSFTSGETITLGESALSGSGSFGVLVDSYTAGGSYRLEITETATGEEEEPNESPRAAFSVSPSSPTVGDTVTVDASASTDPDGTVTGYDWAFGDGSTAGGQTATTTYGAAGEYTVELTVTDDEGATDTTAQGVTVDPDDDGGQCGRTVTTTETGTLSGRGDDDALSYAARTAEPCEVTLSLSGDAGTDFDLYLTYDGRTPTTRDYDERSYNYGSDEEIVADPDRLGGDTELGVLVNSYSGAGDYELLVEEVGGGQAPNEGPTARIDVSPAEPTVGETVTFSGTGSTDPDGSVTGYEWTLGGDRVSTEPADSFTFDEPGEYTAGLTVTDDDGATDTTSATVTVAAEGGSCGDERETASASDVLYGYYGGDTYTYDTRTAEPCRATFTLDGPDGADFDLYLTLDGRTPTTRDYDVRSVSPGPDEEIVLDQVDASTSVGVLVEPASGYGRYTIDVEELGT